MRCVTKYVHVGGFHLEIMLIALELYTHVNILYESLLTFIYGKLQNIFIEPTI